MQSFLRLYAAYGRTIGSVELAAVKLRVVLISVHYSGAHCGDKTRATLDIQIGPTACHRVLPVSLSVKIDVYFGDRATPAVLRLII